MSELRVLACGGGNPTTSSLPLFEAGLHLTGTSVPKLLVVPTAKYTKAAYDKITLNLLNFGKERGLPVRLFHPFGEMPLLEEAVELFGWADLVYVAGGDTDHMIKQWVNACLAELIRDSVQLGEVTVTGISAGMVAWFNSGFSDSDSYEVPDGTPWDYKEVDCLGIFDAEASPHYDKTHPQTGEPRAASFQRMLRQHQPGTIGIGADNSVGMQVVGNTVSVVSTGEPGTLHRLVVTETGLDTDVFAPSDGEMPLAAFVR